MADGLSLARFRDRDLAVSTKPDLTPVTEADRAVEQALRDRIAAARPDHGIVGEEFEPHAGGSGRRWILDPIDGTKNYVRGIPIWATCIALQHDDRVVVGVVSAPALGRRWWAAQGAGAFADGRPIRVSKVAAAGRRPAQLRQRARVRGPRAGRALPRPGPALLADPRPGDFWSHVLVAEGAIDVGVEPEVSLWDVAAIQVIVEEAGGRFTDLAGAARPDGGSAVSTNGLLHDDVLAALRGLSREVSRRWRPPTRCRPHPPPQAAPSGCGHTGRAGRRRRELCSPAAARSPRPNGESEANERGRETTRRAPTWARMAAQSPAGSGGRAYIQVDRYMPLSWIIPAGRATRKMCRWAPPSPHL